MSSDNNAALTGQRVFAFMPDRARSFIIGTLLPYDSALGERVQEDNGEIYNVVADSVKGPVDTNGRFI